VIFSANLRMINSWLNMSMIQPDEIRVIWLYSVPGRS
jgi:hypothetical protein